jgi:hypothetical protein
MRSEHITRMLLGTLNRHDPQLRDRLHPAG